MAGAERVAEKIPGWVERLLIPTLESRVRAIVKDEVNHLEKVMNAKFESVDSRFDGADARFDGIEARFESLEKRVSMIQDIADLKARLTIVEKRTSG
jgi:BMFP domain-containing protein YqiC